MIIYFIYQWKWKSTTDVGVNNLYILSEHISRMELQKNPINLSNYLLKMREYSLLSSKATFWFGGILSLVEEKHKNDVKDDININEKIEIIKIISKVVASIANFYEQ